MLWFSITHLMWIGKNICYFEVRVWDNRKQREICENFQDFFEIIDTTSKEMQFLKKTARVQARYFKLQSPGIWWWGKFERQTLWPTKINFRQKQKSFFVPCGCLSLNLVISAGAKTSVPTVTLFGTIKRLFVLFSL